MPRELPVLMCHRVFLHEYSPCCGYLDGTIINAVAAVTVRLSKSDRWSSNLETLYWLTSAHMPLNAHQLVRNETDFKP